MKDILKKWWVWLIFVIVIVGAAKAGMNDREKPVVAESEHSQTEQNKEFNARDYVRNELTPVIRSVNANIDTSWQYYFVEPIERLEQDGDIESFHDNVRLLVDLFRAVIVQIDDISIPEQLTNEDSENVASLKEGLRNAISKRIEIAEMLIVMAATNQILEHDIIEDVEESNHFLNLAVEAYERLP